MRIRVTFETELPDLPELTKDEVRAWVEYKIGANSWIFTNNPLFRQNIEIYADKPSLEVEVIDE